MHLRLARLSRRRRRRHATPPQSRRLAHPQDYHIGNTDSNDSSHAMRLPNSPSVVETADTLSYATLLDLQVTAATFAAARQPSLAAATLCLSPCLRTLYAWVCLPASQYMPIHILEHVGVVSFTDMEGKYVV